MPRESDGVCRFDSAALSPDGNWLLVTSNGHHVFVGRTGMLADWEANVDSQDGDAMAATLTFTALAPLDREGRSFIASTEGNDGLRRITRLAAAPPSQWIAQDRSGRQSPRGLDSKSGDGGSIAGGAGGTGGTGGGTSGSAATVVTAVRLPGHVESDLAGFATAPDSGMLYVWGPRIGLRAIPGGEGDMETAFVDFPAPIADVAPMAGGDVAVATVDGQIVVVPASRFARNPLDVPAADALPAVSTGLGSFGAIDLWAGGDRIVANAGKIIVDGAELPPGTAPAAGAAIDVTKVRAMGFRRTEDGALATAFVVPWDHVTGQLGDGEAVSMDEGGEVFARPGPIPQDDKLLALAIMREERTAEETPEFEIGFDMLHMRFAGEEGAVASMENCGWVLGIAVRMAGELQENIGEDVKRVCDEPAATAPVINAIFDDRIDERIGALLRLAPASPLAMAVLTSSLRPVAPQAAEALAGYDSGMSQERWETSLASVAENGPLPLRAFDPEKAGFDPFSHWMVAMDADRAGPGAARLADALFHYAYAERLFSAAGVRTPVQIVKRRLALARILSDDVVFDVFKRLEAAPLDPAAAGVAEAPLREVPLDEVSDWLTTVAGGDEAAAKRLQSLVGLVEEMKGDAIGDSDPAAAAAHYRAALALVLNTEEALSGTCRHPRPDRGSRGDRGQARRGRRSRRRARHGIGRARHGRRGAHPARAPRHRSARAARGHRQRLHRSRRSRRQGLRPDRLAQPRPPVSRLRLGEPVPVDQPGRRRALLP